MSRRTEIGCCCNMTASRPDRTGFENAKKLMDMGYDYVELPLAEMSALPEPVFDEMLSQMRRGGIKCRACNNFFPPNLRLTGPEVDKEAVSRYISLALGRASRLGAEVTVFGSAGAKNVPAGFDFGAAWEQIADVARGLDEKAAEYGITVAIEPLNKKESNIINTVREGKKLVLDVNRQRIRLLADYYHMALEKESMSSLKDAAGLLVHTHISRPEGRRFPAEGDGADYRGFTGALIGAGYRGRMSVEAYTDDLDADAPAALRTLRRCMEEIYE